MSNDETKLLPTYRRYHETPISGRRTVGKVLKDQGLFAPHALNGGVEYIFVTPKADEVMVAQSGQSVEGYALKDPKLVYEIIESPKAYSQAMSEYAHTDFPFEDFNYVKPTNWEKNKTVAVEVINIPRRSMRAIVVLFKYNDTVDSEEYIFPNIKRVDVTIDGRPNAVYSNGIKTDDLYRETRRVFHVRDTNMTEKKTYDNKFALVIDLRSVEDNDVMGAGSNISDTKSGVQLTITKEVTTKDMVGEIYVLSDAAASIIGGSFSRLVLTN